MMILKGIKLILNLFAIFIIFIVLVIMFSPAQFSNNKKNEMGQVYSVSPFDLNNSNVTYQSAVKTDDTAEKPGEASDISSTREEVLRKAKEMTEVKWSPKYNLYDEKGSYTFIKGKTYYGIPYSMDEFQARTAEDFLDKISGSKVVYGNDCSGFVSAAWGISRQTTLSFLNAVKNNSKIDNKTVTEITWEELKAGDALLLDNGKGKGHIMLYISTDAKNKDNINVYEQNIATKVPNEPIPVAREDVRSMAFLKKEGYIPIRLSSLD